MAAREDDRLNGMVTYRDLTGRTCHDEPQGTLSALAGVVIVKWLIRFLLAAAAHGVLFVVAALLFDKFSLTFIGWIVGTALFTVFTMLLRGVMASLARKYASSATFLGGVALVWVGLLLTDLVTSSDQFSIEGVGTWIYTTLIVWIGTVIYDVVDDRLIDAVRGRRGKSSAQ